MKLSFRDNVKELIKDRTLRMSYKASLIWIAYNDEPEDLDENNISDYISVSFLADMYGISRHSVSKDICLIRSHSLELKDIK